MKSYDATEELHESVVEFCESASKVNGVTRVDMRGDGNLGGCKIRFDEYHDLTTLNIWGGHQFQMETVRNIDEIDPEDLNEDAARVSPEDRRATKYGPIEVEVEIDGRSKQTSTFGWVNEAEGEWQVRGKPGQDDVVSSTESSLEWALNPKPGVLKIRESHVDKDATVELDIR